MPGLLRGIARTAVVAATAVSNRVSRRQAGRWPSRSIPATTGSEADLKLAQLRALGELKQRGILTEEEFNQQKRWVLDQ